MQNRTLGPLQDVQEAMHIARSRASEWKIDPHRIGVMGFSAGGHLASSAGTHFNEPVIARSDQVSLRPDFLVLVYPVISMSDDIAHKGSREMLLGPTPSLADIAKWSNDEHIDATTPPTMLVHAADDKTVPVANSLRFFDALLASKISAELIVVPAGGHGFGLINATTPDRWMDRCRDWLIAQGWLSK
jgi:acetyl esterase/lipase